MRKLSMHYAKFLSKKFLIKLNELNMIKKNQMEHQEKYLIYQFGQKIWLEIQKLNLMNGFKNL
jgi:hypothetical protein